MLVIGMEKLEARENMIDISALKDHFFGILDIPPLRKIIISECPRKFGPSLRRKRSMCELHQQGTLFHVIIVVHYFILNRNPKSDAIENLRHYLTINQETFQVRNKKMTDTNREHQNQE
jgi:hypothetical protein